MAAGVRLSDATTKPLQGRRSSARKIFTIVLTQGLNRQIRRMCEALGYTVVALQRVRIMHIQLGDLALGRWRNLTPQELASLKPAAPPRAKPAPTARPNPGHGRPNPGHGRPSAGHGRPNPGHGSHRGRGGGGRRGGR